MAIAPLSPQDWKALRSLANTSELTFGVALVDKIKAGKRSWTPDNAIEVHVVTNGSIPCWKLRPDLWSEGQIPPALEIAG